MAVPERNPITALTTFGFSAKFVSFFIFNSSLKDFDDEVNLWFYQVLLGFTGFSERTLSLTGFHWVKQGLTEYNWFSMGFTGFD